MELNIFKDFTAKDVLATAVKIHETKTGEKIDICSKDYYYYSTVAALIDTLATNMEEEARQNFLRYAKGNRLDLKGEFYGTRGKRLAENRARTTIQCNTSINVPYDVLIASGTRFLYKNYIFFTEEEYIIKKGTSNTNVIVVSEIAGDIEEIPPGQIKDIVDKYEFFESCENVTVVSGGRGRELDEDFKTRLKLIPESFTSAGSARAYEFFTKQSSSLVTDVFIDTPRPNYIDIYVLNGKKLVSTEEKEKILKHLTQDHIKALNDQIAVKDPIITNIEMNVEYWIYSDTKIAKQNIENSLVEALKTYTNRYKLGTSINIQDFIEVAKSIEGIKKVNFNIDDRRGNNKQVFVFSEITAIYRGSEER
ncbi:MAG: baseplate assembly protein [Fusobacteriales bacterium]|nr:MAG: baseplate assembly protein [Fusobacteriales bacterium]